nr:zinc finger translocation-associated protein isoform X6 [Misgurnus anguillicaudatus]
MEENESAHKAQQTERRSLVIKAEKGEATLQRESLGDLPTGPSMQDPPPVKHTPGRDHRRYYHEYWRSEYLMDFDRQNQGMICMVCGSSLATLKLSTIKRHIRQRHPYSLLWSESDKDVIRSGWESHLSLENNQRPICSDPENASESEEMLIVDSHSTGKSGSNVTPAPPSQSGFSQVPPSPLASSAQELPGPTAQVLERYLNDTLHAWFRQEFLMEYQAEAGRLVCMVCSCLLPSLHLDHIKSHVLDLHPNSLLYSAEEKHSILQNWAKTNDSDFLQDVKLEHQNWGNEESINGQSQFFPLEMDPTQNNLGSYSRGDENPSDADQRPQRFPRKRRLKYGSPWRLRLDYLVAYGPPDNPCCYCMVCSEHLPVPRVSNFRKHIQACHPETSGLSRIEKDAVIRAWTKEEKIHPATPKEDTLPSGTADVNTVINAQASPVKIPEQGDIQTEDDKSTNITPSTQTTGRNRHYPGKDQRRNYQAHWRMDFLMDYDCRRHGLICMVCGATLATLKVSTIKRHVLQVHPHSLYFSPEEKQLVLLSYSKISLHLHSDDCFSGSNHSHKENANVNTGLTSNQST